MVAGGQRMPRKEDFRVSSLEAWRDNVAIVSPEAQGQPRIYLFNKVGAALDARFGRAMTLKTLGDLDSARRIPLREFLAGARMECAPCVARVTAPVTNVTWCDLVLPLYDGTMPGGRLIFASYPEGETVGDSRRAAEPQSSCEAGENYASL
jgi:hypothetical protein